MQRPCTDSGEKHGSYFNRIHNSGKRLAAYVDEILDLARLSSDVVELRRVTMDLRELVQGVVDEVAVLFEERSVLLRLAVETGATIAEVDVRMIERVLLNLLSNARKFSPGGSTVLVTIADVTADRTGNDEVRISVSDEGPGVPPDEIESIFEPFVQSSKTDDKSGGTGLGLSIVRRIVELHGGRIVARNLEPHGTIFDVTLPRSAPVLVAGRAYGPRVTADDPGHASAADWTI